MPTWMPEIVREHWRILLIGWFVANAVQTMPSPAENGPTSSPLYKWVFAFLHAIAAGVPRIIYTMLPQLVKFLPFNGQTQPPPDDPQKPRS
jgi:hypothetical protein